MKARRVVGVAAALAVASSMAGSYGLWTGVAHATSNNTTYAQPTWWRKYQDLSVRGAAQSRRTSLVTVGTNVDVSNESTPQSETAIQVDPTNSAHLVAGSNEIV